MKSVFIMDALADVKAYKDTSYQLMLAAGRQGHQVFHVFNKDIFLDHDNVMARVSEVNVNDDIACPFEVLDTATINLSEVNLIFIRTDPPFDERYFYTTLLLDFLPKKVKVINRPSTLRDWNEKLAALRYPQYTPKTLICRRIKEIEPLLAQFGKLTVKPIDGHGGSGIIFIETNQNWKPDVLALTENERHWVVAQEYLPAAAKGDKRILLVNGEPIGAILRVHAEGVELNNLDAGGRAHETQLDDQDREICAAIKDDLINYGVYFCGIDVIGGKLIEINVTSPTGLKELSTFSGIDHPKRIISQLQEPFN